VERSDSGVRRAGYGRGIAFRPPRPVRAVNASAIGASGSGLTETSPVLLLYLPGIPRKIALPSLEFPMLAAARRIMARAPTYAAYVRERPAWLLLIMFGRLNWARWIERKLRAGKGFDRSVPISRDVSSPPAVVVAHRLRTDGVCEDFRLSAETLEKIQQFSKENPCSPRDDRDVSFLPRYFDQLNRGRKKDILAAYYFSSVEKCDAIRNLMIDPRLVGVARNYLGQDARNIRTRLWWSFPAARFDDADLRAAAQDRFHFDLNDWRTIKFFFYLSDVSEESGPHIYIRGTHRRRQMRHQYTMFHGKRRDDLEAAYGKTMFKTVIGRAGSGFAEDPFVFHTGSTVRLHPRLILELEFGPYDPSPSYRYGELG
jgi:hypothetical protein